MDNSKRYAPDFLITAGGVKLRHGVSIEVISLAVTETYDKADSFTFTISDRHPEPARFAGGPELKWMDNKVLDERSEVTIEMGYVDDRSLKLVGEITAVSPSFPESGVPTLTVRGFSLLSRLQRKQRQEPFESATDSGIADEIATAMGLTPMVDPTEAKHPALCTEWRDVQRNPSQASQAYRLRGHGEGTNALFPEAALHQGSDSDDDVRMGQRPAQLYPHAQHE